MYPLNPPEGEAIPKGEHPLDPRRILFPGSAGEFQSNLYCETIAIFLITLLGFTYVLMKRDKGSAPPCLGEALRRGSLPDHDSIVNFHRSKANACISFNLTQFSDLPAAATRLCSLCYRLRYGNRHILIKNIG